MTLPGFRVPNRPDVPTHPDLADVDRYDWHILAMAVGGTGVLFGGEVTTTGAANGSVAVAAGMDLYGGRQRLSCASGTVAIPSNASGQPRYDFVCVDTTGTKVVVQGTPAAFPVFPDPGGRVVHAVVKVPNGHTAGSTIAAEQIVDKRVPVRPPETEDFSVLNYAASHQKVGDGDTAVDEAAVTAMLAEILSGGSGGATNQKEKRARFPGGHQYGLSTTRDWPNGVHFVAGPGSESLIGRKAQFRWQGTAGGTMFRLVQAGDRVVNTLITEAVFREGSARPGKWWELGDAAGAAGIDMGARFDWCDFYNADAPAGSHGCLDLRFGPTNFWMRNFRADNWTGAFVRVAVNNAASHFHASDFTLDTVSGGGVPFWLDGTAGGNNKDISATIARGKIEFNSVPAGAKTVVRCTMDPTASQAIQHRLHLDDVRIAPGGGVGSDYSFVKAERTDAVDTNMIYVQADNCVYGPGVSGRLIEGVVDPNNWGVFTGKIPNWMYTPRGYGFATPGGEGIFNDYQTQTRYRDLYVGNGSYTDLSGTGGGRGTLHMHNALAVPSSNPVGGGIVYVEAGALKYRGPSGTVTTIALA